MIDQPKILVANGVNLDLLGRRERDQYGDFTLADLQVFLVDEAKKLATVFGCRSIELVFFQTNDEVKLLEKVSKNGHDGILLNPAAWTHTSLALADRMAAVAVPFVEVHISNLSRREAIRQKSLTAPHACGVVYGLGLHSYGAGLSGLMYHLMGGKA